MDRSLGLRGFLFPSLLILLGVYLIARRLFGPAKPQVGEGTAPADLEQPSDPGDTL